MHIAIVYRPGKPEVLDKSIEIAKWLTKKGIICHHHPEQTSFENTTKLTAETLEKLELVIVFGGDGTYLNAVRMLGFNTQVPVLGINMGSLGFLTQAKSENLKELITQALESNLAISKRSMLEISLVNSKLPNQKILALNDIVFERGNFSRLISMAIKVDNTLLNELKADGLIVATPTGSTAYNLSAGGPILTPEIPATVITPICPHSLTNRPLTIPDTSQIEIQLAKEKQKAIFMIDGYRQMDLTYKDKILIKHSKKFHHMLLPKGTNQLEILRLKLSFGQRN